MTVAYPLHWPMGYPRTQSRGGSRFNTSISGAKMRHGGLAIVRASFRGYASLPPPTGTDGQLAAPWWQALGLPEGAPLAAAEAAYREAVKQHHPDRGGDPAKFNLVTNAIKQARETAQAA